MDFHRTELDEVLFNALRFNPGMAAAARHRLTSPIDP